MGTITYRNRSKGRVKKDGSRAKPSWEYRFSGPQIRGKRTSFSKGGFATKQEAVAAGTKAYNEYMSSGTVFKEVNKVIYCGDFSQGHALYQCSHCGSVLHVPFRCKSRFCNNTVC